MALTIVDTDILVDVARGDSDAADFLSRLEQTAPLPVSAVTRMELIVGCRDKKELKALERFLNRFLTLRISEQISDRAADLLRQYCLSHGLLIADGLIAVAAPVYDESFVTKNQRHFRFITGLKLLPYP